MDEHDLYLDEHDCEEEDAFRWPSLEEQLAEIGMRISDFI